MTLVQAHRGLCDELPENTIAAFAGAIAAGFPCLEMDLRMTHDHEVVVLHDANIARTTDGVGRVADLDYDELREYDTGAGPVPRFDDVLSAFDDWAGLWNIEIKANAATEEALHLLAHHDLLERSMITAMDPEALQAAHRIAPEVSRGLITLGPPDEFDIGTALELRCAWLNIDHDFYTPELQREIQGKGLKLGLWTVNDADDAHRFADDGVDSIITDRRDVLAHVPGTDRGF